MGLHKGVINSCVTTFAASKGVLQKRSNKLTNFALYGHHVRSRSVELLWRKSKDKRTEISSTSPQKQTFLVELLHCHSSGA